jgi:hypothetical protein
MVARFVRQRESEDDDRKAPNVFEVPLSAIRARSWSSCNIRSGHRLRGSSAGA